MTTPNTPDPAANFLPLPSWLALVRDKVEGLRYGMVQLVVHDGRVTLIERTEKTRLVSSRETEAHG